MKTEGVYNARLDGKYNGPYQPISEGVIRLADAEGEEASVGVDSSRADAHRIPANFVQHHSNSVHLVGLDVLKEEMRTL